MREYLDVFVVDHRHDGPTDCVGNPSVVDENTVKAYAERYLTNVSRSEDGNTVTGELTDEEGLKYFTFTRVYEKDNALTVNERLNWKPTAEQYVLTIEPDWEKIPEAIKSNPAHQNQLSELQGTIDSGQLVQGMLATLSVCDVHVHDDGRVEGYDLVSASRYVYSPVEDAA